jgi:hypothetical protein
VSAPYPPTPGDRPPPFQLRHDDGPPPPRRSPALVWTLRVVGLLAIATLSGLVWFYIQNDDAPEQDPGYTQSVEQSDGEFDFAPHSAVSQPITDENCAKHAYGKIEQFLAEHDCRQLVRGLYTTTVPDGRTVYTSVSVVRMADEQVAAELRKLTDTDNTGNVNDLVREKVVTIDGLETLSGSDGYASAQHGTDVVIVESDYDPTNPGKDDQDLLDRVCKDALRLDKELTKAAG